MRSVSRSPPPSVDIEPTELLATLEDAEPPALLRILADLEAAARSGIGFPEDAVGSLLPHLSSNGLRASTARLLGVLGHPDAIEPIRVALAHSDSLDVRLVLLEALALLGQSNFAIRTLRSMLLHGDPKRGSKIVDTIDAVAGAEDAKAIARMVRVAPPALHLRLGCIAYRLGELSTYAAIVKAFEKLSSSSPAEEVEQALRAVARVGSQRFASHVLDFATRESRPWFSARAHSIASSLATHGLPELDPESLFVKAREHYFEGEHDACLEVLSELNQLGIVLGDWKHLEASCLRETGRLEEAQRVCELGIAADPKHWQNHRLNGSLLWDLKDYHEALAAYDRALMLQPTDPYAWYYKGYALYCMEQDEAALPCLNRAISLRQDAPYLYNQKAFCLERLGRTEEAIRAYQKSLQLRPGDVIVRDYLGQALQSLGRVKEALACFDQAIARDPTHTRSLYHRADALYDLERWEDAESAYTTFLALEEGSFHAWFNRGLCNRFMRRFRDAVLCFEQALLIRPDNEEAQKHLSYCLNPDSWLQDR